MPEKERLSHQRELHRRQMLKLMVAGSWGVFVAACTPAGRTPVTVPAGPVSPTRTTPAEAAVTPTGEPTALPVVSPSPVTAPKPRDFGIDSDITLTPNETFYTVSYNENYQVDIDVATWRLQIEGLVDTPLSLSLDDIKAMPATVEMRTLECIGNYAGGFLIGNAVWKGVVCASVLDQAGIQPEAVELNMVAADGYVTSIPVELAQDPRSLLVYEMNGEPLPADHGFPLRCLWPGRYGQKQPKWLTRIELVAEPTLGYWESQGWSNEAIIRPNSQIRAPETFVTLPPEPIRVSGFAFANRTGVAKVEVSTDNGETWHDAEVKQAPEPFTPFVWTEWWYLWEVPQVGKHWILARVTDGSGETQHREEQTLLLSEVFPSGTKKIHAVQVIIEG